MFFLFKYVTNGDSFLNRVHESWIEKCRRNIEHAGLHGDEWGNWRRKYQILLLRLFAVSSFPLIVFLTKPAPGSGGWVCFGRKGMNCTAEVLDGKKSMS